MKTLYLIILILLLTACADPVATPQGDGELLDNVPVEWLTRPPTPDLTTTQVIGQHEDASNVAPSVSSDAAAIADATEVPPTPIFRLPRLFGRQWTVSAEPGVPEAFVAQARQMAADRPDDFLWVEPGSLPTDITIAVGGQEPLGEWIYVVAGAFPTIRDEVSESELRELWAGADSPTGAFMIGDRTLPALRALWGRPGSSVTVIDEEQVSDQLWAQRPAVAILPFDALTPALKVLAVDGASPFKVGFARESYPLRLPVGLVGEQEALAAFLGAWNGPAVNYDPGRLTRVALTGVTALVRATAAQMEIDGILTPAKDVGPILRGADIAHVSNEVSFVADCPEPSPIGGTSFCSQDDYFALLQEIGADVIELTGNHLNDYGAEHLLRTIDMYEAAGMSYFGGGRDAADAQRAATFEHNGNRIALTGCNFFGPTYAWATDLNAGSRACGPDFFAQIGTLKEDGYVVLATEQYTEYYQYPPTLDQQAEFRAIAEAGAAAVSGSQGHHAQGFELHDGAFIHYGLGNLFFDQMDMMGTRQAFVDIYSIYDGRLVNVDLWTGLIENYFQPRTMTVAEREEALQAVFEASGW